MRITNHTGLPEPLVRAVSFSDYDKGDSEFSITDLIKPPQITALERKHWDEIEEDAADRLWLLMGSAGHEVLRRSATDGIVEERCHVELDGVKISGQIDYAKTEKAIWDFKFTSFYAVREGPREDWVKQLNCYRWMARQYGVPIERLIIVAIYRDWSKSEAQRNKSYPQQQVGTFDLPMWTDEQVESFLRERISLHRRAQEGDIVPCTPDETWERPEKWAVMKKGNVRAVKLHDGKQQAEMHAASDGKLYVERRPGSRPRCESYCSVAKFCPTFHDWKRAQAENKNQEMPLLRED